MLVAERDRQSRGSAPRSRRFVGYPQRLDLASYDEAVERYARAVAPRAVAVYRGGAVRFPGLSDIDLLVVVDERPAWDNEQYFSPHVRLPNRFHALFHHRPHFVPISCLDTLEHTTFAYRPRRESRRRDGAAFTFDRRLIAGRDVLPKTWPALGDAWYVCSLLESFVTAKARFDRLRSAQTCDVVRLASMASTFRYPLRQLDERDGTSFAPAYCAIVDRARAELLEPRGEREAAAKVMYALHAATLSGFERAIARIVDASPDEDVAAAARDVLAGRRDALGLDGSYLAARRAAMLRYFEALCGLRLSGLAVFVRGPYRSEVSVHRQPRWEGRAASAFLALSDAFAATGLASAPSLPDLDL